ncbi:BAHD family acyltransferase [Selaginella moellendorffii]|uniref:BAHD family acyltransferase n=1 Tax=Selaginella moellendorffii TaxID=88036 RepID=D8R944_SELML|nr:BAHD family acyltransferase [Selaginella moellendorffii]
MASVSLIRIHNVTPATPTPQPCWKSLSNVDLLASSSFYSSFVHYYMPPQAPQPFEATVAKLKRSLALTLTHYFVFAGRVQAGTDGSPKVNCNDAGIPLRVASTDARFDDWQSLDDCSIEQQLNTQDRFCANSPTLQIQITRFGCGGIALGGALCETVADGYSVSEFFHAWSRIHRGLPITPPLFHAELFQARNPPRVTVPMRDYVAAEKLGYQIVDAASTYRKKIITVSSSGMDALVHEVEAGPFGFGRASSFVALSALIWKSITEARELPNDATTRYMYPVSCRGNKRFKDPPVPMSYFGNAIHLATLPARAGDIKSHHISFAAKLIHNDIAKISGEYIQSAVDWMEIQRRKGLEFAFNVDYYAGRDVNCTTMHTFPIFKTDFGWGQQVHYTLVPEVWFGDGTAFVLPTAKGGRERKVALCMPSGVMERFLGNMLVTKFTSCGSNRSSTGASPGQRFGAFF